MKREILGQGIITKIGQGVFSVVQEDSKAILVFKSQIEAVKRLCEHFNNLCGGQVCEIQAFKLAGDLGWTAYRIVDPKWNNSDEMAFRYKVRRDVYTKNHTKRQM